MKKLFIASAVPLLAALLLIPIPIGCGVGTIGDPESEVATLQMQIDHLGALKIPACMKLYGEMGCSPYPNPLECEQMLIRVKRDGRTCAECRTGSEVKTICGGVAQGIPLVCSASPDLSCQECVDIYNNTLFDTCNRNAQFYRSRQTGGLDTLGDGSGFLTEDGHDTNNTPPDDTQNPPDNNTNPNPPPDQPMDKCDANMARQRFADAMNVVLAQEGLGLRYKPLLGKKIKLGGLWGLLGLAKGDMCKHWLNNNSYMTRCWNTSNPGKCHCKCNFPGSQKQTCRCGRITIAALRNACQQIPPDCDYKTWVGAYVLEYGSATAWLNAASYTGGYFGGIPYAPETPNAPPDGNTPPGTPPGNTTPPSCLGSPLVLDLGDNGVQPTGVAEGVSFNLLGSGKLRTAWVQGDDALLVLDRNGNGRIDSGAELFGEATDIGGARADNGFAALAALDRPMEGGNGNGLLETGDLIFSELRLWSDRNRDGISQPAELMTLSEAGIRHIELTPTSSSSGTSDNVTDSYGNDLSLRGSFTRMDGRKGLVVDVLFKYVGSSR